MLSIKVNMFLRKGIYVLFFCLWVGCKPSYSDVVRDRIAKNGRFSKSYSFHVVQVIPDSGNTIVVVRADTLDEMRFDPFMFFLDNRKNIVGVHYLAGNKIDSIVNRRVYYVVNENRAYREDIYGTPMPTIYTVCPLHLPEGRYSRYGNKLILNVKVLKDKLEIVFKKSDDLYYTVGWRSWDNMPEFEKGFTQIDTVFFSYTQLTFDYRGREINYDRAQLDGNREVDRMIFQNKNIQDKFYDDLFNVFIR